MIVVMKQTYAGEKGVYEAERKYNIPDEFAKVLIKAGSAEVPGKDDKRRLEVPLTPETQD